MVLLGFWVGFLPGLVSDLCLWIGADHNLPKNFPTKPLRLFYCSCTTTIQVSQRGLGWKGPWRCPKPEGGIEHPGLVGGISAYDRRLCGRGLELVDLQAPIQPNSFHEPMDFISPFPMPLTLCSPPLCPSPLSISSCPGDLSRLGANCASTRLNLNLLQGFCSPHALCYFSSPLPP